PRSRWRARSAGNRRERATEEESRNMRYSIALPNDRVDQVEEFLTAAAVADIARTVEEAGFDACFVTDHPFADDRWLGAGGHHALEPLVQLSFAAAATRTLLLHTNCYVLAYRNPFLAAKSVLSLDVLSGGRVILGVAAGYLKPEFSALGVDFDERNALTDEAVAVMRRLWSEDDVAADGAHFHTRGTTMHPRPPQGADLPIWIGGTSRAAMRRAVDTAQGWVPFPNPASASLRVRTPPLSDLDALATRLDAMREYAREIGRTEPIEVCFAPFSTEPAEVV